MILFAKGGYTMVIAPEDNIPLSEVIRICKTIKNDNIEIAKDPIQRPKTCAFIEKYELLDEDIKDIIHNLSIGDYHSGPVEDDNANYKRPLWIFIKYVDNIHLEVYIKIKIINNKRKVFVLSIHEEGLY